MQEEVEGRTVTLIVSGVKLTGRVLKQALDKYLLKQNGKGMVLKNLNVQKQGKQSVKSLMRQGQGLTTVEIKGKEIRQLERISRKYGIDYAIKKVKGEETPTYQIYIRARDKEVMTQALSEFIGKKVKMTKNKKERPSVLQKLNALKEKIGSMSRAKIRNKERVR